MSSDWNLMLKGMNGCKIILLQAYSLQFYQESRLDIYSRNQNFYLSREGFKPRDGGSDMVYFNGPWMGAKPGECWCGCGKKLIPPKRKWAHERHAERGYLAQRIVETPGPSHARVVLHVLQRGTCALCMEDLPISDAELDHKIEVNEGGGGCWLDNLQNLCKRCHRIKTGRYNSVRRR